MTSLPADFNFAAVGDWECKAKTNNTANNIVGKSPELVLALGYLLYKPTADGWFQIIGPIDAKMKIVTGNHDVDPFSLFNF